MCTAKIKPANMPPMVPACADPDLPEKYARQNQSREPALTEIEYPFAIAFKGGVYVGGGHEDRADGGGDGTTLTRRF
jgi:hypothetical protein